MKGQIGLKNGGKTTNEKLDFLRRVTAALLDEVKTLGAARAVEVEKGVDFYDEVKRFEVYLIERALDETGGCQLRAARLLNMKHTTLHQKIKNYKIPPSKRQLAGNNGNHNLLP